MAVVNNHWHSVAERRTTLAQKGFGASTTLYRFYPRCRPLNLLNPQHRSIRHPQTFFYSALPSFGIVHGNTESEVFSSPFYTPRSPGSCHRLQFLHNSSPHLFSCCIEADLIPLALLVGHRTTSYHNNNIHNNTL